MFGIPLQSITNEHVIRLVAERATETRYLEFKRQLPDWSNDRAVEEMMGDIAAFGNALGGYLIYGISEGTTGAENTKCASGVINAVDGDEDSLIARVTHLVRSRIEPRGFEVEAKVIECEPGIRVMVLRIPESYRKPLRVQSNGKWYLRYNNSKVQMEYQQIRDLFVNSGQVTERIREFRGERISAILSNDSIAPFQNDKLMVYHFVPLLAYEGEVNADLSRFLNGPLFPPACNGINGITRPTMDGVAFFGMAARDTTALYSKTEIFRSGVIEMVDALTVTYAPGDIHLERVRQAIAQTIPKGVETLKQINVSGRVAFFLSILNVGGMKLARLPHDYREREYRVSRRNLHFPDVIFDLNDEENTVVRDTLTILANAFGVTG